MVINHEESPGGSRPSRPPVIFNPDFFVEKLRHENPDIFLELVLSNITRLIDLPGTEFSQLLGEEGPKTPTGGNGGFFRSFNFLKRKDLHLEGLFRVPGNSVRQQTLKELLNSGVDVDLESGDFHPNDANRALLKLLLDLLYHTARQQDKNKMSAFNLALMFAPHVVWPRHMTACDLKDNLKKLNNSMAFLIKHSQKLFRDDLELFAASRSPAQRTVLPLKRSAPPQEQCQSPAQQYTEEALKDLFRHLVKQTTSGTPTNDCLQVPPTAGKKHPRSLSFRSFGGLIKRKARGEQLTGERRLRQVSPDIDSKSGRKAGKENVILQAVNSPLNGHMLGKVGLVVKNPDFAFKDRVLKVSKV
ncbi:hypothetical protein F7725_006119 [Dissostichus mawsoni]|uniref:Rho-GAP domain-containing protein n=1 Tax=Dissostichus mawsoni TaxID=36200 RepID=A0A7J5YT49_DISMA|nr:hypothetical protein F7725_006119 [Dissostichus mawsoni]